MTTKEINKRNESIAIFMKAPKCKQCDNCGAYQFGPSVIYHPNEMLYSKSMDWLYPVCQKMNKRVNGKITFPNIDCAESFDKMKTAVTCLLPVSTIFIYVSDFCIEVNRSKP